VKRSVLVFLGLSVVLATGLPAAAEGSDATAVTAKLAADVDAHPAATPKVKTFIKETLIPLCTNPVFVEQTQAQNAQGLTLEQIKKTDQQWAEAEDELPIHNKLLNNACAEEIRRIVNENPAIGETFVTDNQGANVGQNELTSDYWQGDEPKWQKPFNNGQGGIDIAEPKLDKSTNAVDQKISLPIIDGQGNVIGTVTFGILVDRL